MIFAPGNGKPWMKMAIGAGIARSKQARALEAEKHLPPILKVAFFAAEVLESTTLGGLAAILDGAARTAWAMSVFPEVRVHPSHRWSGTRDAVVCALCQTTPLQPGGSVGCPALPPPMRM